jgi:hypothetical protein
MLGIIMRYAIIKNNIVDNVVPLNSGAYIQNPTSRIELQPNESCAPGFIYRPGQTPRFVDATPKKWTSYEFLNRFTAQERALIRAKSKSDDNVADFEMLATAAQEVNSDDPVTIAGMDYLVSINIITAQRKSQILGEM